MPRKVNSLILNNEVWALSLRLRYEYEFFDYIVVTESRRTFANSEKPLYAQEYAGQIPDPDGKIIYVIVDELPYEPETEYVTREGVKVKGNRWPAEHAMRNAARSALESLNLTADDLLVVQDIDEIGNLDAISQRFEGLQENHIHRLAYVDYRGTVSPRGKKPRLWNGGFMARGSRWQEDLHDMRRLHVADDGTPRHWHIQSPRFVAKLDGTPMYELVERPDLVFTVGSRMGDTPGWHLSGMTGGFEKLLAHKRNSFSHAEFDKGPAEISGDFWAEALRFMEDAALRGEYDFSDIDDDLPCFIKESITEFPVLLDHPRHK